MSHDPRTGDERPDTQGLFASRRTFEMLSRRTVLSTAVLGTLGLVAGCSTIPSNSQPQSLGTFTGQAADTQAPEPVEGAGPEAIVRGFIAACADPTNLHSAARKFLTAEAADSWDDSGPTTIARITGVNPASRLVDGVISYTVRTTTVAMLDAAGAYTPAAEDRAWTVELTRVEEEWRIAKLPAGVVIEDTDLKSRYRPVGLAFLSPSSLTVVADRRWVISPDQSVPSPVSVLNLLVQGPRPSLNDAVISLLHPGTIVDDGTEVAEDHVVVRLRNISVSSDEDKEGLAAQIVHTLHNAGHTRSVEISIDGTTLPGPAGRLWSVDSIAGYRSAEDTARAVTASDLRAITPSGVITLGENSTGAPVPGVLGTSPGVRSASLSWNTEFLAAIRDNGEGAELIISDNNGRSATVTHGRTLTRPTWKVDGSEVWTVRDGRRVVRYLRSDGTLHTVDLSELGLGSSRITALRLSPDGVRAAYVAGGKLFIAVISQSGQNPLALTKPVQLFPDNLTSVQTIDWRSAANIIIGTDQADFPVVEGSVDGSEVSSLGKDNLVIPIAVVAACPTAVFAADHRSVLRLINGTPYSWSDVPALVGSTGSAPVLAG